MASPTRFALELQGTGERFALIDRPVSIGRSPDCDVTIADDRVSRRHAHMERRDGRWTVVDDGSSNGTNVNGEPIPARSERAVDVGDVISVGPFQLHVVDQGSRPVQRSGPG